jgi:hypothetical protein
MTRRRHLAALFAPLAALLLAACAAQNAPVAPASPSADAAPMKANALLGEAAANDLEGQIAALGAAEDQIARVMLRSAGGALKDGATKKAEEQEHAREPSSLATASPTTPPPPKVGQSSAGAYRATDDGLGGADPCVTACSALSSMERATRHLCDLTGEGDARCDSARSRVSGATERVTASCPACAGSR